MQSFTTQSHQRNYQGNVVVENPNQMLARVHQRRAQRGKFLAGITTSVMALAVAVTGSMLGATALHNQQLKHQVQTLRVQATQAAAAENNADFNDVMTQDAYYPTTLELHPTDDAPCHKCADKASHYPIMTLEARPTDEAQPDDAPATMEARDEDHARPNHDAPRHRRHGERRTMRRVPVSEKQHDAQPLPNVDRHHEHRVAEQDNQ